MKPKTITPRRQLAEELLSGLAQETLDLIKFGGKELAKAADDMGKELGQFAMGQKKQNRK